MRVSSGSFVASASIFGRFRSSMFQLENCARFRHTLLRSRPHQPGCPARFLITQETATHPSTPSPRASPHTVRATISRSDRTSGSSYEGSSMWRRLAQDLAHQDDVILFQRRQLAVAFVGVVLVAGHLVAQQAHLAGEIF